jgi:spore photoproduct lyase
VTKAYANTNIHFLSKNQDVKKILDSFTLTQGKRILWLTHFKGNFLKPCPGTANVYRCCNYIVINQTTNCPIDCSYCILQGYLSTPVITIYTNYHKIEKEIKQLSFHNPERILRVGTGELTDSLALDPVIGLSQKLIKIVQDTPNILLELKTKTDQIEHLLRLNPDKIIFSWSVNPEPIILSEEHKSSSLQQRLHAAIQAIKKGFLVGIHFDPIIYLDDWKTAYSSLIQQIAESVDPNRIAWISLGSLRFPKALKDIYRLRFPKSRIFSGEQIEGLDGKLRYIRPIRISLYSHIYHQLKKVLGNVFVYFCMESEDIWQKIIGKKPTSSWEIDWYFAKALFNKFPELKLPKPRKIIYQKQIIFP